MNITEHEMRGLLTGKCLPGDMRVNEELPAYLVRKFAELKCAHDAHKQDVITWEKSMMAAIGEDGTGSVAKAIAELKEQRDALAAENAVMKDYLKECSVVQGEGNWTSDAEKSVYVPAKDWMPPTPATDAYLNSVRAEGVDLFSHIISKTHGMLYASSVKETASDFAAELRAGKDGE